MGDYCILLKKLRSYLGEVFWGELYVSQFLNNIEGVTLERFISGENFLTSLDIDDNYI
jgi:hypothetical protein|tara:strand:+ start:3950 stop:4123 length:174 start_codon:yes stop_codon:yes gene_type:complete